MTAVIRLDSDDKMQEFPCKAVVTIGRDKNNDIIIKDRLVSRNHAIVRRLGEEDYYLIDEGSANCSFINAKKVVLPTLLADGDKISIGGAHLSFRQKREDNGTLDDDDESAVTVLMEPSVEVRQFTILVVDIRGFTSLSETIPIKMLTEIMNQWFHAATECVDETGGIVDKFLGDCVYARWEADGDAQDTVQSALKAACNLNKKSSEISKKYPDLSQPIRIGAGIHTGIAALGVDRSNTAIGDAVNLAFRLEGATKEIGKDIILSSDAYIALQPELWQQKTQTIDVKGKAVPVEVLGLDFDDLVKICY
ncbi:MAG: FHA domain-containing protein [Proteobacteria bacterium]|nr:FHA domain-containing protein [Pseudomonadota bacterium]